RLHLVYALWLMDAASLERFLGELVRDRDGGAGRPAGDRPAGGIGRNRSTRDERFWRERAATLAGPVELPLRPDWRQAGPAVRHRTVTIEAPVARRLVQAAGRYALTPSMVYLAAYGVALGRLGGGVPHTLTVLYSQRALRLTGDSLGNLGNTMPLE